jgi:glycine/sarcosine N-methyltransferase
MGADTVAFYNDLAEHYHLIYESWDRSIEQQARILGPLLEERLGPAPLRIFDCACGIGTQAIGLAKRGHAVVASDLSDVAVRRAQDETRLRGLQLEFHVADMQDLSSLPGTEFDAVVIGDNALPHLLSDCEMGRALNAISGKLRAGGVLLATIRDYDHLLESRPPVQGPAFYSDDRGRRIVHQVWDWDSDQYTVHLYLTWDAGSHWITKHYMTCYRAVTRKSLSGVLESSGFQDIEWLMPETSSFYQPIVLARKKDCA